MMKRLLLFLCLICIIAPVTILADNIKITGRIVDEKSGEPMGQATVVARMLPDSVMLKGTVTSENGNFELSVKQVSEILLNVSFLGYSNYIEVIKPKDNSPVNLGTLKMKEAEKMLKETIVKGQVPPVVVKEDTIEYNVDSYKMQPNSVVEDMLKKLPGVDVDSEGKITANGKEVKKVFVDGKEFFSSDPTVATKNLNTDIIDKLQIIDKKSDLAQLTGVDDGDDETVINLTIKKGMKNGWFGNVLGAYGYADENPHRYEGSAMVNRFEDNNQYSILGGINNINKQTFSDRGGGIFSGSNMRGGRNSGGAGSGISTAGSGGLNINVGKSDDFRIGGNILFSGKEQDEDQETYRENILEEGSTFYNSSTIGYNKSRNASADLKMEWKIDSLTKFELQPSVGYNRTHTIETSEFLTTDEKVDSADWVFYEGAFVNKGTNFRDMTMEGGNYSARATLSRESAFKAGRKVSLSVEFNGNITDGTSYTDNRVDYEDWGVNGIDTTVYVQQKQLEKNHTMGGRAYLTWVEPFGNNRFLQLSYNANASRTTSDRDTYLWDNVLEAYSPEFTDSLSDHIRNTSLTHTAGISIRTVRSKYNYNIGVNVEPSMQKSENLLDSTRSYKQEVINYSPLFEYNYLWSKRKTLRIRYRGRTTQPSINQLQPSKNNSNPLFIQMGNMDLKPSYTNNLSLRYSNFNSEKLSTVMASVEGAYVLNSITNKTTYDRETGVQTTMPVNVDGVWNASARLMFNIPMGTHFQINSSSNASYNHNVGFLRGNETTDAMKNISQNYTARENLAINYRSDLFDLGVRGNCEWTRVDNSLSSATDQSTLNYGGTATLTIYLPFNIVLNTDYTFTALTGYAAAFGSTENLWNAKITKTIFNKKGSIYFSMNDILHDRKTITRRITTSSIQDVWSNQLTSYAMIGFTYRFSSMGKRNSSQKMVGPDGREFDPDMMPPGGREFGPPPGGGRPGGGGMPPGGGPGMF